MTHRVLNMHKAKSTIHILSLYMYYALCFVHVMLYPRVISEIESSIQQRYKRALSPKKDLQKVTSDLSNLYGHSIFKLLLIKQIFEKNKSSRAVSKSQTQFWPQINPDILYEINPDILYLYAYIYFYIYLYKKTKTKKFV